MQIETDTTTEEREAILQRAIQATNLGHRDEMHDAMVQIQEHMRMYPADEGLGVLEEQMEKMEMLLAADTPDSVAYQEHAGQ